MGILVKMLIPATLLAGGAMMASGQSKNDTTWKHEYRGSAPKINDLVHTKLAVSFDYDKSYMYGKAWITLQPHCYPTDSLTLDAKGMDIKKVAVVRGDQLRNLTFAYDSSLLDIHLDKTYKPGEKYTVYIDYVSRPNELKAQGSAAITDARGLYFINPKGTEKDKPTQIWTQGETESNSAWFPTIDKPDQKSTEEIEMTVPSKYVTLSNGLLVHQTNNGNGTRTDDWKMDLPHAPYLFFMGVGDYAIIKDSYEGKDVAYYVEKPYAPVARRIFGYTPEMIAFYSKVLGVDFPWAKYDTLPIEGRSLRVDPIYNMIVRHCRELDSLHRARPRGSTSLTLALTLHLSPPLAAGTIVHFTVTPRGELLSKSLLTNSSGL